MNYNYELLSESICYDGFFKFYAYHVSFDCFSGGQIENVRRECGKRHDIVAVLPFDPIKKQFLMVEQFRIGMMVRNEHPWTKEIVAGFMDVVGEGAEQTAIRETKEETGCNVLALQPMLSYYPGPGGSAAKIHLFLAKVNSDEVIQHTGITEEGEDIKVHKIDLFEAEKMMQLGQFNNATTVIAFQQFFLHKLERSLD